MCSPAELLSSDRHPLSLAHLVRSWELVLLLRSVHLLAHLAQWMLLLSTWPTVVAWLFCDFLRLRAIAKAAAVIAPEDAITLADHEFETSWQ